MSNFTDNSRTAASPAGFDVLQRRLDDRADLGVVGGPLGFRLAALEIVNSHERPSEFCVFVRHPGRAAFLQWTLGVRTSELQSRSGSRSRTPLSALEDMLWHQLAVAAPKLGPRCDAGLAPAYHLGAVNVHGANRDAARAHLPAVRPRQSSRSLARSRSRPRRPGWTHRQPPTTIMLARLQASRSERRRSDEGGRVQGARGAAGDRGRAGAAARSDRPDPPGARLRHLRHRSALVGEPGRQRRVARARARDRHGPRVRGRGGRGRQRPARPVASRRAGDRPAVHRLRPLPGLPRRTGVSLPERHDAGERRAARRLRRVHPGRRRDHAPAAAIGELRRGCPGRAAGRGPECGPQGAARGRRYGADRRRRPGRDLGRAVVPVLRRAPHPGQRPDRRAGGARGRLRRHRPRSTPAARTWPRASAS